MREAIVAIEPAPPSASGAGAGWTRPIRIDVRDFLARAGIGTLFLLLSINLLGDFGRTHNVTGLLLLISEALVVVMTILRRRATIVDRSVVAGAIATLSLVGPPLLRAGSVPGLVPDAVTASVAVVGLSLVVAGKVALGRSFGIVPANRGIVASGPYLFVRHPIYTGYLITHAAFLVAHPEWTNLAIAIASDIALVIRALYEERTLVMDESYRRYCARVKWHFAPGLF